MTVERLVQELDTDGWGKDSYSYSNPVALTLSLSGLYCLLYNSCDVILENSLLDQPIIPLLIFVFILITFLHGIVLIL